MDLKLKIGDLIRFKEDTDPYSIEVHHHMKYRAKQGQLGVLFAKSSNDTRFKAFLSSGGWAEITVSDFENDAIEIIAKGV